MRRLAVIAALAIALGTAGAAQADTPPCGDTTICMDAPVDNAPSVVSSLPASSDPAGTTATAAPAGTLAPPTIVRMPYPYPSRPDDVLTMPVLVAGVNLPFV